MRFPDDVPTLGDGVVTLRAPRESDLAGVVEQCNDETSIRWTTVPLGYTEADARDFLFGSVPEGWRDDTEYLLVVEAERDGVPAYVGNLALRMIGDGRADIGFGAHPWSRGRGLMERACRLILRWGFEQVGLASVEWWAHEGNWASRRLAWKVGFTHDGRVRRHLPQRGDLRDAWVGTVLAGEDLLPRHPWLEVPVVEGPRVRLRPLREDDDPRVVEACSDPVTSAWLGQLPAPYTAEHAALWRQDSLGRAADGSAIIWAVADRDTDEIVAALNLFDIAPGKAAEIGYWTHPSARGRGLTVEACRLGLRHAFLPTDVGGLHLEQVHGYAALGNAASRGVLASAGLLEQGVARSTVLTREGLVDAAYCDLLREEWEASVTDP